MFVAIDTCHRVFASTNGNNWVQIQSGGCFSTAEKTSNVLWTGTKFVYSYTSGLSLDISGRLYSSSDGIKWAFEKDLEGAFDIISLAFDGTDYAATAVAHRIIVATDSKTPTLFSTRSDMGCIQHINVDVMDNKKYSSIDWYQDHFTAVNSVPPKYASGATSSLPGQMQLRHRVRRPY